MDKWLLHPNHASIRTLLAVITAVTFPLFSMRPLVEPTRPQLSAAQLRRNDLEQYYQAVIQPNTDLESFARLAWRAASYSGADVETFLDDLSWLIMGAPDSRLGIAAGAGGRILERLHTCYGLTSGYPALMRFGSSGFRVNDHSNQVQHFWFSVIVSYHLGASFADGLARYHEWNAPGLLNLLPLTGHGEGDAGDLFLSRQAIWLGQALRSGSIQPAGVADWLRQNL